MIRPQGGWAALTAEHRADLVRFATARLGRSRLAGQDAEDLVQEVLARMLTRDAAAGEPAQLERPAAYLRRAVANECVSHWRRHHREIATDDLPDAALGDHAEPTSTRLAVYRALRVLTARQREILTRGYLLDHSDADIARELGISQVTVRTLRRRGLAHLRRELSRPAGTDAAANPRPPALRPLVGSTA